MSDSASPFITSLSRVQTTDLCRSRGSRHAPPASFTGKLTARGGVQRRSCLHRLNAQLHVPIGKTKVPNRHLELFCGRPSHSPGPQRCRSRSRRKRDVVHDVVHTQACAGASTMFMTGQIWNRVQEREATEEYDDVWTHRMLCWGIKDFQKLSERQVVVAKRFEPCHSNGIALTHA